MIEQISALLAEIAPYRLKKNLRGHQMQRDCAHDFGWVRRLRLSYARVAFFSVGSQACVVQIAHIVCYNIDEVTHRFAEERVMGCFQFLRRSGFTPHCDL